MKNKIIFAALTSVLIASCSSNNENSVVDRSAHELGVTVAPLTGVLSTRSIKSSFVKDDQVAVFVNGTGYIPSVSKYILAANLTTWTPDAKIYLSNEIATVYGFYPASATATLKTDGTSTISVSVPVSDAFGSTSQDDYMYATSVSSDGGATYPLAKASNNTPENGSGGRNVNLVFHHALSKLSFVVNRASTYTGTGTLSEIKLESTSATDPFNVGSGTMNVGDGTFSFVSDTPTSPFLDFTGSATINPSSTATDHTTELIVAPKKSTQNITLSLKIDGKMMTTTLPATLVSGWTLGKNYVYTVIVNGTELIIQSIKIQDWIETTGGSCNVE